MVIDKEFAELIPPLAEEEYRGLEASIVSEGCRDALVCWGDILIDGHNRYKICEEHGIEYRTVEREFSGRNEVLLGIMKNQLSRRNLNDFQRIEIVRKCENAVKAQARERQLSELKQNQDTVKKNFSERGEQSRDTLGSMAGVSGVTYEHAVAIIDNAPDPVKEAVRKQEISINAGYEATKLPPEKQSEIATRIESGEKPKYAMKSVLSETRPRQGLSAQTYERALHVIETAPEELKEEVRSGNKTISQAYQQMRRAEKEAAREESRQKNAEKVQALSNPLEAQGLFQTIVIDPAWDWGDEGDVSQFGRARPDYRTMPLEEIEALPISRIADENCHLYLWITNRSLPKGFHLMEAWGFRYITCLTWVKPSIGMGNYFRGSTEQVLFGVKGSQPLKRHDVGTWFDAPRGKMHSEKPDEFYSLVESCSYAPYIDIFGRKEREGWTVWGENA